MVTTKDAGTASVARTLTAVLLDRRGALYVAGPRQAATLESRAGVALLEADLLDRGYLVGASLRAALVGLEPKVLAATGTELLADLDRALGADRPHVPLLRRFPDSTPADTYRHFVDRMLVLLFQHPDQPCVLCGTAGDVLPVSPCAHLVCGKCFDGADFSACPICERRIDADDPFLRPRRPRLVDRLPARRRALPVRLRVITLGGDLAAREADAGRELDMLLARTGALGPQEADDLDALLLTRSRTDLDRLPATVPGREVKARLLAWMLADADAHPVTLPFATRLVDTATDVLRLLAVRSGGDAGLVRVPRLTSVPRALRRALLAIVDGLDPALAAEDMRRHRGLWIHAAEVLHPFEYASRYPRAALAFAAVRRTRLADDGRLATVLREAAQGTGRIDASGAAVTVRSWSGEVEAALGRADTGSAVALLAQRPGELVRRLHHMLRLAGKDADAVLDALERAVPRVAPAVLLSALGEIRTPGGARPARVFFPKGGSARTHLADDERLPLSDGVVERTVGVLTAELLRRAGDAGEPVDVAVVDAELGGVIAPFTERTAARALVTLPRGSELALPEGRTVRLFLHWMESETSGTVDLDLSAAMFDAEWRPVGSCSYTGLRYRGSAAVHSGDLQSAPPPTGASEFVDLDLELLAEAGVRHVVAVVYSYNNVPFEELAEGFAGLMARDEAGNSGPVFDPRAVEQRFDLTGASKSAVPLVIDVSARTMRWLDVTHGVTGSQHAVWRHENVLATLGQGLTDLFASGARVGLGELAVWRSAVRAATVFFRRHDGSFSCYRRREDESVMAFAARIGTPDTDAPGAAAPESAGLAHLVRGDLPLPAGSEVYALHPGALEADKVRLLTAADVVAALAPR
ncbi:MXAN_6230/SCO0854 family RING domain-containing protein [Streptomyces xantholiticus]|uniref:MXAN_6230/SCO0854 family RING domain-containing protein n=1 Tax=Streptomyces xantholiticus TaxID=68285 RepID=UPI001674B4A6|nr:MXAN_6230/SCO0854 family RING domain-containing protein [Streptomyces xantholiticus]GGW31317.1 hypothetical protein GCM10010381_14890 [Streptomyces xantholiticus]